MKVSSKLSDLKPLHASCIVDLYEHIQENINEFWRDLKRLVPTKLKMMVKKFLKEWKIFVYNTSLYTCHKHREKNTI